MSLTVLISNRMNQIQRLTEALMRFPGIGPRQAKRLVFFLLTQPKSFHNELASLLRDLEKDVTRCGRCFRYFNSPQGEKYCSICVDANRNQQLLMVVEKDVDLDNIERSGAFDGLYFVLGGTVPILDDAPHTKVRSNELLSYIDENAFDEIILAMSANPDGDHTGDYIKGILKEKGVKVSMLGRGLSTGSELEYSDQETIKNAFENRT